MSNFGTVVLAAATVLSAGSVYAVPMDELTIYDVQYTTDPTGDSPYNGQIHSVIGGIVTHVWQDFNDRVYLQDPNHPTWGAIVVKDGEGGELSNAVNVGDMIRLDNIYIDEFRGTTFLQYGRSFAPNVSFSIVSTGEPVPAPLPLTAANIVNPADHAGTEPYESMVVTLEDVVVGQMDLGKADDNYELLQGSVIAWATDYMNVDAGALYDPRIETGAFLERITGIVEQYTKPADDWDYYQLNTRSAGDIIPEPATALLIVAGAAVGYAVRRRRRPAV